MAIVFVNDLKFLSKTTIYMSKSTIKIIMRQMSH